MLHVDTDQDSQWPCVTLGLVQVPLNYGDAFSWLYIVQTWLYWNLFKFQGQFEHQKKKKKTLHGTRLHLVEFYFLFGWIGEAKADTNHLPFLFYIYTWCLIKLFG